jgi:membrane-associated protein
MIDWIKAIISSHPEYAPIAIAASLMLAGLNIPISADVIIIIAATLAATLLKGSIVSLYLAVFVGSCVAAYFAYLQGRFLGHVLMKKAFFKKLFPQERLEKINQYYKKHSWATLIIGRFIPFGFRNALFISAGLSKFPFRKLIVIDLVACFLWSSTLFTTFYHLISKTENILPLIKKFNLIIFFILGLSIISLVWYKQAKRRQITT